MKILIILLLAFTINLHADTKYDLAEKFLDNGALEESVSSTVQVIHNIRNSFIRRFTPSIEESESLPDEINLAIKQLKLDLHSPDFFAVNRTYLRQNMISAFANAFTVEELQELRGEPSNKTIEKLKSAHMSIAKNFLSFAKKLNADNAGRIKAFEKQHKEISKLTAAYYKAEKSNVAISQK